MVGMTRPGAFAEMMSIPAGSLIPIPDRMAYDIAALTEPAATAFHAINLSKLSLHCDLREASVLVIGGGAIGMFSALLLRSNGVSRLRVAEVNENRRNSIAAQIDCCVFDPRSEPVTSNEFDLVVDCVGSVITRKTSLEAVSPGGVVMHIGLQDWASEIDMRKLTLAEITLLGTYTYTTDDLKQTVAMLDAGVFGDCRWIEKRPLRDGAQAFSDLHYGRAASAKIVLEPYG
jgi:alcohol dehydrogenase